MNFMTWLKGNDGWQFRTYNIPRLKKNNTYSSVKVSYLCNNISPSRIANKLSALNQPLSNEEQFQFFQGSHQQNALHYLFNSDSYHLTSLNVSNYSTEFSDGNYAHSIQAVKTHEKANRVVKTTTIDFDTLKQYSLEELNEVITSFQKTIHPQVFNQLIWQIDKNEKTPLHYAAQHFDTSIVYQLLGVKNANDLNDTQKNLLNHTKDNQDKSIQDYINERRQKNEAMKKLSELEKDPNLSTLIRWEDYLGKRSQAHFQSHEKFEARRDDFNNVLIQVINGEPINECPVEFKSKQHLFFQGSSRHEMYRSLFITSCENKKEAVEKFLEYLKIKSFLHPNPQIDIHFVPTLQIAAAVQQNGVNSSTPSLWIDTNAANRLYPEGLATQTTPPPPQKKEEAPGGAMAHQLYFSPRFK